MKKRNDFLKRYLPILLITLIMIGAAATGAVYAKYLNTVNAGTVTLTVDAYGEMDIDLCTGDNKSTLWTDKSYQMIPGTDITIAPSLYLKAGNEKGYVFIEVEESIADGLAFSDYITYSVDTTVWTQGDGTIPKNVYWKFVRSSGTDSYYNIIAGDKVSVPDTVTEAMMASLSDSEGYPKLSITAYSGHSVNLTGTEDTEEQAALAWDAIINNK